MQDRAGSSPEGCWWSSLGSRLTLRPAYREDDSFLVHLFCNIREADFVFLGELERKKMMEMQFAAQQRHYQVNMPGAEHLIILQDSKPIGRLIIIQRDKELRLAEIALLTEHRNHGVGSRLMEKLIKAEAEQRNSIRLHVYKQSPAVRFYQRLGFVTMKDDGVYLFMEKLPAIAGDCDGGGIY
jgi:ribosomal protein S18 acetylase RimI-like enzyme